jgi:hypothetical protein
MFTMPRIDEVILDRSQEISAHQAALDRARVMDDSYFRLYGQNLNYHEMITQHAESAGAEIAVAEWFGITGFNPSINSFKSSPDVETPGVCLEVKHTRYANGALILQANQSTRPNDVCVLVVGKSPVYRLVGWMPASMALVPKYKHPRQESYWVPQPYLFEMRYLRKSNYGDN